MVSTWLRTRPDTVERKIHEFSCGEALLEYLRLNALDILFLDCKMTGMDGIETAKAIRKFDSRLVIIMLTDFEDYARFGYGADIMEYILKSEFTARAASVFDKAVNRVRESDLKTYSVKTGNGLVHMDIADILYIESHARKKEIFTRGGRTYEFYGRIDDLEDDLRKYGFVRPHKSFLVNSDHIRVFAPQGIWLSNYDVSLPVSRGRFRQAYDEMTIYATEVRA
jgi:DNA-binding LytR/AlgR family response regulator